MTEPADLSVNLPAEADAAEVRDSLPDDLDARGMVGPYVFPDNDRRRIPGVIYLALALATVVAVLVADGSPLVDGGLVAGAVALALLGAYHLQAGWSLEVDEAWADDQPRGIESLVYCNFPGWAAKTREFAVMNDEILDLIDAICWVDYSSSPNHNIHFFPSCEQL